MSSLTQWTPNVRSTAEWLWSAYIFLRELGTDGPAEMGIASAVYQNGLHNRLFLGLAVGKAFICSKIVP